MANNSGKGDDPEVRPDDPENLTDENGIPDPVSEPPASKDVEVVPEEEEEKKPGPFARLARYLSRPSEQSREAKSGERTRGLVVLTGTAIACVFLFFGLFTTDSRTARKESKATPSLGRSQTVVEPEAANRSLIPQHSVHQQPNEDPGELTEGDVLGTMRNRGTQPPAESEPEPPPPPRRPTPSYGLNTVNFDDPALAETYRRQGLRPPAGRTEVTDWTGNEPPKQPSAPAPTGSANDSLRTSSIVYVRSGATGRAPGAAAPVVERSSTPLLPQGTALVARLQHAVSSAAKVPVTAVIEYNYEEDGQLVVPAGTKAYGELSQATPQGWVSLKFHTLVFPNGDQERINGSAISMERTALRGDVNGRNGARKFLTRTLTGVGTIAAFAVGGRGLSGGIDNSVLLRERLASNVALAGEQELAMLAYRQSIVVTVPANTRFYLVLHEAGVSRPADTRIQPSVQSPATAAVQQTSARSALSEQELREMMQLRNELREMNRLMQLSSPRLDSPVPENR